MKSVNDKSLRPVAVVPLDLRSFSGIQPFFWMLLALFAVVYGPVSVALARMWWGSDDYSHGFLVPVISLYLVWMKREHLRSARLAPSYLAGILVMALAGLMLVAGDVGGVMLLQELSLLIMITGLVLLLAGGAWLKILAFPIAYLLFMIKLFGEGDDRFHWPFQLLAANIGVWLLHLLGFPAYQHDQFIELPRVTLKVIAACSGIRFLMSIIAIGIPLAYLTQKTWPRKIGLVGFAVLVAILANGLRVALIGVWTYYHGAGGDVHGPFHVLEGVLVSWIGFIALFVGAWLLGEGPAAAEDRSHDRPSPGQQGGRGEAVWPRGAEYKPVNRETLSLVTALLMLAAIGGYYFFHSPTPHTLRDGFRTFPTAIGAWRADETGIHDGAWSVEGADEEITRLYRDGAGRAVTLSIGYFNEQLQGKELINYKTSWKYHRDETQVTIPDGHQRDYRVNRAVLTDGGVPQAVLFWYDLNGRVIANRYRAKLWTIWDAIVHGRTDGALVVISAPLEPQHASDLLFVAEEQFLQAAMTAVHRHLDGKEPLGG